MQYRKEIDGLRALAVIPVILFHAGFDFLSGGFVGVDVFFVISGYLITSIILEEKARGQFTLAGFYERRARRILPALFVVMLCCLPFAWMWMVPSQLRDFSQSLAAVTLFISNVLFWTESGYFSAVAEEKPLLHTWSLAVEEQYYVVFPVFIILAWRLGKQNIAYMITLLAVISFLLAEWLSRSYPTANFYLAPTRVWEIFSGALCAFFLVDRKVVGNTIMSTVGLLLIVLALFFINDTMRFPSVYTLLPILGACLIILFSHNTWVGRLLSLRPLVGIGLVSYSAYLWHQPLFAFARIKLLQTPSLWLMLALAIVSILLAVLSWKYIERPFRSSKNHASVVSTKWLVVLVVLFAGFFIGLGLLGHKKDGFHNRFELAPALVKSFERGLNAYECFDLPTPHISERWGCNIGNQEKDKPIDFMVFGDSHLLVTYGAFKQAAENLDVKGYYAGIRQCTPFLDIHALRSDQNERNCHQLNKRVWQYAKDNKVPLIVLVSRWSFYTVGGYTGDDFSYIGLSAGAPKNKQTSIAAFEAGLDATIKAYESIGTKVVLLEQVPQQQFSPEEIYYKAYADANVPQALEAMSVSRLDHDNMQRYVTELFAAKASQSAFLDVASVNDVFCGERCLVGNNERSFYHDEDHLSVDGGYQIVEGLETIITQGMAQ